MLLNIFRFVLSVIRFWVMALSPALLMLKLWPGTEKRNRFYLFRFSAHEKER